MVLAGISCVLLRGEVAAAMVEKNGKAARTLTNE